MYVIYFLFNGEQGISVFYRDNKPDDKFDCWYPSECVWFVPIFSYDEPHLI